jgi:hypothetical protein
MQESMTPKQWVELLREAPQGAIEAPGGPIRVRGMPRMRGDQLAEVIQRLRSQPVPVRLEVVQQLAREADEVGVSVLRALAVEAPDPDANVRWTIAEELGKMRHPEAVRLLEELARSDPDETVRGCAIGGLGKRAMEAYRAEVGADQATPRALVRTRGGAVRTRGASPVRRASPEAQSILDMLYSLRDQEQSDYVKGMADLALRQLGE